ncbi:hypothetical protein CL629_01730 [bacterium]|nr:hypothetical protein [bacterium]|tara:strand:+ start:567 stop:1082 length:516 start_codon:yes stop_codon:yes gene_type:complete
MKKYTIILLPEKNAAKEVKELRIKYTGQKFTDALPPHITLRRSFFMRPNIAEIELKKAIQSFSMKKITTTFSKVEKMGENTLVLLAKNEKQFSAEHEKITTLLNPISVAKRPEWDKKNYKPHLTIFRKPELLQKIKDFTLPEITFDTLCLYDIDPSPAHAFADKVICKKLT